MAAGASEYMAGHGGPADGCGNRRMASHGSHKRMPQRGLPASRSGQKLLSDDQLGILREENLHDENFVRREIAGGDRFRVEDVLPRINQDGGGIFFKGVV